MTFDVLENPLTGERAVVRQHAVEGNEYLSVGDVYAAPGSAVLGEHLHPQATETFTVVRGLLGLTVNGVPDQAGPGDRVTVPPGVTHDWWNAGTETALVIVEMGPQPRFEEMIRNQFLLAADGRLGERGRPNVLQAALFVREFSDVVRFTSPPVWVQKTFSAMLAPLARLRGYRGSYPDQIARMADTVDALEELPPEIAALLPHGVPGSRSIPSSGALPTHEGDELS